MLGIIIFVQVVTIGARPDGRQMDPEQMPWPSFNLYTDEEVRAIWAYLQTVASVAQE